MDDAELKKHILSIFNDDKIFNQIAQEAFNSVDTDHSGAIDKVEFKESKLLKGLDQKILKMQVLKKFTKNQILMEMETLILMNLKNMLKKLFLTFSNECKK